MNQLTVSILGCGWLGEPLAQKLVENGYTVKGSTTTPAKKSRFAQESIKPFIINVTPEISGGGIKDFFNADILVLTLPFKRQLPNPAFYFEQIQNIVHSIESSVINFVIFTSSTAVYPNLNKIITESDYFEPADTRASILLQTENYLRQHRRFDTTIVRLAGLYGENRLIGKKFSGKTDIPDGNTPVNLIHQEDAVNILFEIIKRNIRGEIFNACSDDHPAKRKLYTQAALKLGIPAPRFKDSEKKDFKIVSNAKLKKILGYQFKYPTPLN